MHSVNDLEIIPSYRSDHSTVVLSLQFNDFVKGKGLWKFNVSLLKDKNYVNTVKKCINDVKEQYMLPVYDTEFIEDNANNEMLQFTISHQLFLEVLLMEIRGKTISYSAHKKKQNKEKEDLLQTEIEDLEKTGEMNLDLLETKKEELENLRKEKLKGIIIRSRVRWAEEGEKPTNYFCNLESRNYINKTITKIEKQNGQTITKQEDILNEVKLFYENLYENHDTNDNQDSEIISILENIQENPKLSLENKNKLEGELTDKEILAAVKKMKNNKSPGTDGFTSEFFKFFYNDIKVFIKKALNEGYENGKLSISQRQGLITCLPKGDKPKQFLKNWRPITLLNVIYKIASSCIAERIKTTLTSLISDDQTGFISGRYIGENTRLIYDILHITDELDIPGLLLIVDFEKAFDSISWKFINHTLNFFNFGESIKKWINVFYNDIQSCVIQNGFLSEPFNVKRGCRQGDPLSPYIFLLCAEILSRQFKASNDIKGIQIAGIEYLLSQFADDTTILLDGSENSLDEALKILNTFALASGLKLNSTKTRAVWIGSKKFSGETFNHRLKLDWNQTDFTILGIKFSCNIDTIVDINYNNKLIEIEKEMKQWSKRILTPLGRLTVLKTLLVSKLNHLIISLPNPSARQKTQLNKLFFEFIWKSSIDKIKRDVIIQDFSQGGLRMIHLEKYIYALKLGWIRRLILNEAKYKTLFQYIYENIEHILNKGDTYIEELKNNSSNKFWYDVFDAWIKFIPFLKPKTKEDVMSISIWENSNIKINGMPVFYQRWYDRNIIFIKDLLNSEGKLLSFEQFQNKYDLRCHFLQFLGIKTAVGNYIRQLEINLSIDPEPLMNCVIPFNVKLILKHKKGSQDMYRLLVYKTVIPKSQIKWNQVFQNVDMNWKSIYTVSKICCRNTKLYWFQYRLLHRILATKYLLTKMNIEQNNLCTFCGEEVEKLEHLFWQCNTVNTFWENIEQWIYDQNNYLINIDKVRAIFGILNASKIYIPVNYILTVTRYYIYNCKLNENNLTIQGWQRFVKQYLEVEKMIAIKNDTYMQFNTNWGKWLHTFDL